MIKVYKYGLRPPIENEAFVREQMLVAHRYRNTLVQIARGERAAKRTFLEAMGIVAAATNEAVIATDENRKERFTVLYAARKAAMRMPEYRAERERIDALAKELRHSARRWQAPWWGTYAIVEDAMDRSLRRVIAPEESVPLDLWDGLEPADPRFVRISETSFTVQAYNNAGPAADTSRWLSIEADPSVVSRERHGQTLSAKRAEQYRVLALQVGTESRGGARVWARWPMVMHRPLPADVRVIGCKVILSREGPREKWEAHFTVETSERHRESCGPAGRIAIDIGWRAFDEPRVAFAVGDDGECFDLRLPRAILDDLTEPAALRSIRDDNFNLVREWLACWLASCDVGDALRSQLARMSQWRSQGRLASVVIRWRKERVVGDENAFALAEAWRVQDKHLWHWECAARAQSLGRRKQFYRDFARKLALRYSEAIIEEFDISKVAKRANDDKRVPRQQRDAAQSMRFLAATSELRRCITDAFAARGGASRRTDAAESTHECPTCRAITEFPAWKRVRWTCEGCLASWDQDESAARVLLLRDRERPDDGGSPGTARTAKPEKKWARVKRQQEARAPLAGTARKPDGKSPKTKKDE